MLKQTPTKHHSCLGTMGENLRSGFAGSKGGGVLDITFCLECSFVVPEEGCKERLVEGFVVLLAGGSAMHLCDKLSFGPPLHQCLSLLRDVRVGDQGPRWRTRFSLPCIVLKATHLVVVVGFKSNKMCNSSLSGTLLFGVVRCPLAAVSDSPDSRSCMVKCDR